MVDTTSTTSLREVIRFPFSGPDWQKRFIIGAALIFASFFIPIVPLVFVCGYWLHVMRLAIGEEDVGLPPCDEWGTLALDGLRALLVSLAYTLPALLVFGVGLGAYATSVAVLPLFAALAEGREALPSLFIAVTFVAVLILFLSMFVGTLLLLLGLAPLPTALAHLAAQGELAAAFHVRQWWRILRANPLGTFIAWVVVAGLSTLLYVFTMLIYYTGVLCCLTPFLTALASAYIGLVSAVLFGRVYRESVERLAARDLTEAETLTGAELPAVESGAAEGSE